MFPTIEVTDMQIVSSIAQSRSPAVKTLTKIKLESNLATKARNCK